MNIFIRLLTERIEELFKIYERYIWKNDKRRLVVVFQNEMIYFYLYDEDNQVKDEIYLSFDKQEETLYKYMCYKTFLILFGNVPVHKNDEVFYSNGYKNYIGLIVKDNRIYDGIERLADMNNQKIVDDNDEVLSSMKKQLKRKYDYKFINKLSERIKLSSDILLG